MSTFEEIEAAAKLVGPVLRNVMSWSPLDRTAFFQTLVSDYGVSSALAGEEKRHVEHLETWKHMDEQAWNRHDQWCAQAAEQHGNIVAELKRIAEALEKKNGFHGVPP